MPVGQTAVDVTKFRNLVTPSAKYVLYFKFWYRKSSISTSIGEVQFLKLWLSQFSFHISSSNAFKRFPPRRRSLFSTKCYIMDSTWRIKHIPSSFTNKRRVNPAPWKVLSLSLKKCIPPTLLCICASSSKKNGGWQQNSRTRIAQVMVAFENQE